MTWTWMQASAIMPLVQSSCAHTAVLWKPSLRNSGKLLHALEHGTSFWQKAKDSSSPGCHYSANNVSSSACALSFVSLESRSGVILDYHAGSSMSVKLRCLSSTFKQRRRSFTAFSHRQMQLAEQLSLLHLSSCLN